MKLSLRYIPTEVWVDIFRYPWITRKQLGRIVHRFKNRRFAEFLQFYLHDWGKRKLEYLDLYENETLPLAPLPDNIKSFHYIRISDFDSLALDFLHRVSTLFVNYVNLKLDDFGLGVDLTNLRTTFDHVLPLLHGIHSLEFKQCTIPLVEEYFGPKLAQIKMLSINFGNDLADQESIQSAIDFCLNWLTSEERDSAEPRLLDVRICWQTFQQLAMAVQQQFLSAKSPCTFVIRHTPYPYDFCSMEFTQSLPSPLPYHSWSNILPQNCHNSKCLQSILD